MGEGWDHPAGTLRATGGTHQRMEEWTEEAVAHGRNHGGRRRRTPAPHMLPAAPTMAQLHVAVGNSDERSQSVSLTILWPAHRLTRAMQATTTGKAKASIQTANVRRTRGRCVAAARVLGAGHRCGGTCECGAEGEGSVQSAETAASAARRCLRLRL